MDIPVSRLNAKAKWVRNGRVWRIFASDGGFDFWWSGRWWTGMRGQAKKYYCEERCLAVTAALKEAHRGTA
mgnify:CR=1 FL=1